MVVEAMKPDVVIVLGKELQARVLPLPQNIVVIRVNHPSSGFRYARWIPVIAEGLKAAREAKLLNAAPEERPSGPQFEDWLGISSRATKPTPAQLRTGNWCDSPRT
jgi:hypothetical protein